MLQHTQNQKKPDPYMYAIRLLSRQDYSQHKLIQKLSSKGFSSYEIESTIKKLLTNNELREESYAVSRLRYFLRKGIPQDVAKIRLKEEKVFISDDMIEDIYQSFDYTNALTYLLSKKLRTLNSSRLSKDEIINKLLRFATNKGYSLDEAKKIIKTLDLEHC